MINTPMNLYTYSQIVLMVYTFYPNKIILQEIVELLQQKIQLTTLYKIQANIKGNEKLNKLAKKGSKKEHVDAIRPYKFAHSTPYYCKKDSWHSMTKTLDKGPIRFFENHIIKYDKKKI